MELNTNGLWKIEPRDVYRNLGYRQGRTLVTSQVAELIDREMQRVRTNIKPRARVVIGDVLGVRGQVVRLRFDDVEVEWQSRKLAQLLRPSIKVSLMAVTLGQRFDQLVESLLAAGEITRATILDAVGSAAIEGVALGVGGWIDACAAEQECQATWRFAPGYGDWNLEAQDELLCIVGADIIGITVTSAHVMRPDKSLSGIVGWIPVVDPHARLARQQRALVPCTRCGLIDCQHRRADYVTT